MIAEGNSRRRGSPLLILGVLLGVWIAGRAAFWENPFPVDPFDLNPAEFLIADGGDGTQRMAPLPTEQVSDALPQRPQGETLIAARRAPQSISVASAQPTYSSRPRSTVAAGHQLLMAAAIRVDWTDSGQAMIAAEPPRAESSPLLLPATSAPFFAGEDNREQALDRWSLDVFAFYRQGSTANPLSVGRVPVYGASQLSANLQYRVVPHSPLDPRLYLRAYRALVTDGESEIAAGASVRPLQIVPLRFAGEVRVTQNPFGTEVRPAAYAVTEIPAIALPLDFRLETYGGAGYVGGDEATYFADGQLSATREIASFDTPVSDSVRLSLGAGAWGGIQEDANRVDVGPTMRVDLTVGQVPARLSVDWRERVGGDAAPSSGVAATLSTRF